VVADPPHQAAPQKSFSSPSPPLPTFPHSQSSVGGPDVVFDAPLVPVRAVRDAFLALVAARFARAGVAATRVAAVAVPIDAQRGLYDVRVGWRGGGDASVGVALAAVNDVPPGDACGGWRADHDVCAELQSASLLDVIGVQASADTAPPGANAARLSLGRRPRGLGVPASVGNPRVQELMTDGRLSTDANTLRLATISQGQLKDIYWYVDKMFEGKECAWTELLHFTPPNRLLPCRSLSHPHTSRRRCQHCARHCDLETGVGG